MTAPIENLTPYEHTRRALHHSIDRICDSWPLALEDANSRGYPQGIDYNVRKTGTDNTSVETAALNPSKAVAWLAELGDLIWQYGLQTGRVWHETWTRPHMHMIASDHPDLINEHLIRLTIRLANVACILWPPPPKPGDKPAGNQYDAETCLYCQIDAYPGQRRAIKHADGTIEGYCHKTPCWYAITMGRGTHPRQKLA